MFERTHAAAAARASDRAKLVKKIVGPLTRVGSLIRQANLAPNAKKFGKKIGQARRVSGQAEQQLAKARGKLSATCVASLASATTSTATTVSCLP